MGLPRGTRKGEEREEMEKEGRTRGKGGEGGEVTPYFLQTDRLLCLTEIVAFQKTI